MKMVPLRATLLTLCLFTLLTYGKSNTPIHKGMEGESDNPGFVPDLLGWKWKLRGAKMLAWYEHYYGDFACDTNCTIDTSSFASTEFVCTSDGVDIGNPYCTTGEVYIDCKSSEFDKDPTNGFFFFFFSFLSFSFISFFPSSLTLSFSGSPTTQKNIPLCLPDLVLAPPIAPAMEPVVSMVVLVTLVTPEKIVNLLTVPTKIVMEEEHVNTWMTLKLILVFAKVVFLRTIVPLK